MTGVDCNGRAAGGEGRRVQWPQGHNGRACNTRASAGSSFACSCLLADDAVEQQPLAA